MPFFDDPELHVGDRLRFVCSEVPEICVQRTVGPDGTVDVPTLGAYPAAARRLTELTRAVFADLPFERLLPRLEIRWIGSAASEVVISGAVERSLRVYAPRGIDRDRLMAAAKPTKDADLTLLSGRRKVAPGSALALASATTDRRIGVLGAVAIPQSFPPAIGLALSSALESAGGLSVQADPNGIVVVRGGEEIPVSLPADAGFPLRPGDVVRVGLRAERHYLVVRGLVARPGSVDYAPGMTAMYAIEEAGGVLEAAKMGTLIWQKGAKSFRLSIAFLLDRRIPDPVLGPTDSLVVEAARP